MPLLLLQFSNSFPFHFQFPLLLVSVPIIISFGSNFLYPTCCLQCKNKLSIVAKKKKKQVLLETDP